MKGFVGRILIAAIFVIALALCAPFSVKAQAPGTGAITGKVIDPSGGVVPQAGVTVLNDDNGLTRTVTVASDGIFRAPLLPPPRPAQTLCARSSSAPVHTAHTGAGTHRQVSGFPDADDRATSRGPSRQRRSRERRR